MTSPSREAFEATWPRIVIPGEFDGMDSTDQSRWSGALLQAFEFGIQHARDVAARVCNGEMVEEIQPVDHCYNNACVRCADAIKEALK